MAEVATSGGRLHKEMTTAPAAIPEDALYASAPGIGLQSVAQLIGELGDIRQFDNANQLNAYVGIDLNRYHSGQYTRQDHINKRGNPHLLDCQKHD